jgi:hypothetical protein
MVKSPSDYAVALRYDNAVTVMSFIHQHVLEGLRLYYELRRGQYITNIFFYFVIAYVV